MIRRLVQYARSFLTPPGGAPALPAAPEQRKVAKKKGRRRTSPRARSITRWLQRDVESAQQAAAAGDLTRAGQIYRALSRDGMLLGLLGTRSGGLVRLPKRFSGDAAGVEYLAGTKGSKGAFDRIFPVAELAKLARDGYVLGVGVAEFIDDGCGRPTLVRLDPEFLLYRWWEDAWFYRSALGLIPITPNDGRWVLYLPGGRQDPWEQGAWAALARAYVSKEHALFYRENWNGKLAHPARVAIAPQGASQVQKEGWFRRVMAWGINTVFGLTPGYDVKLLESNGVGYQSFKETIADSNTEFMVLIAGQVVTVTGGTGFANANIHATIRGDLIEGDGRALATCLCEQALPHVLVGIVREGERVDFEWDTRPPTSRKDEAEALTAAAKAIEELVRVLTAQGIKPDVEELAQRFGVPRIDVATIVQRAGGQPENDFEIEIDLDEACDGTDACDTDLRDEAVAALAAKMTEHAVDRCEHGHSNRCWKCGIERMRDFEVAEDGLTVWTVAWRPIPRAPAVAA